MGREKKVGPVTEYLAGELRAQRARKGWTIDEVAKRTGVARSTVDRCLKGETAIPAEVLVPLAIGMELDLGGLMDASAKLLK